MEDHREMTADYSGKVEKPDDIYGNAGTEKKREAVSSMFLKNCILKIVHFELSG
jgi:hypothetical protein